MDFNESCSFAIDVSSGSIELTLKNVSLPSGSLLLSRGVLLTVGVHPLQSRVVYFNKHKTNVYLRLAKNFTGTYGGVKLAYRRISKGKNFGL